MTSPVILAATAKHSATVSKINSWEDICVTVINFHLLSADLFTWLGRYRVSKIN